MDCGANRGVTVAIKKKLQRRNAVEPVIGHMKADGRLGKNFLKGAQGDAMNALLCGAGHTCARSCAVWRFCAPKFWKRNKLQTANN